MSNNTSHRLVLPCKDKQQEIIKSVNNYVKRLLPENYAAQHAYKSRKLGFSFHVKDQRKLEQKPNHTILEYFGKKITATK